MGAYSAPLSLHQHWVHPHPRMEDVRCRGRGYNRCKGINERVEKSPRPYTFAGVGANLHASNGQERAVGVPSTTLLVQGKMWNTGK
jgi:hypothetical protein